MGSRKLGKQGWTFLSPVSVCFAHGEVLDDYLVTETAQVTFTKRLLILPFSVRGK